MELYIFVFSELLIESHYCNCKPVAAIHKAQEPHQQEMKVCNHSVIYLSECLFYIFCCWQDETSICISHSPWYGFEVFIRLGTGPALQFGGPGGASALDPNDGLHGMDLLKYGLTRFSNDLSFGGPRVAPAEQGGLEN